MESIIGIVMIYAWIHGAIIVFKKVNNVSKYEYAVLIAALVSFVLFLMGSLMS